MVCQNDIPNGTTDQYTTKVTEAAQQCMQRSLTICGFM
jgi:hypothetical protein